LDLKWIYFEKDCKIVVDMIHSMTSINAFLLRLLQETTSYVYHKMKKCADFLAKEGVIHHRLKEVYLI
jgi:hypothetical protein